MHKEPCRTSETDRLETLYVLGTAAIVVAWLLFLGGCSAAPPTVASPGAVDLVVGQPRSDEVQETCTNPPAGAPCNAAALRVRGGSVGHDARIAAASVQLQQDVLQRHIEKLRVDVAKRSPGKRRHKNADASTHDTDAIHVLALVEAYLGGDDARAADARLRLEQLAVQRDVSKLQRQIAKLSSGKRKHRRTKPFTPTDVEDVALEAPSYLLRESHNIGHDAGAEDRRLKLQQRAVKRDIERLRNEVRKHSSGRSHRSHDGRRSRD